MAKFDLHKAAREGSQLTADALLAPNKVGITPLHLAVNSGCLDAAYGIELPDKAVEIVGPDWWKLNQNMCKEMAGEDIQFGQVEDSIDIDL